MKTIAIDYGTSNCATSFVNGGEPSLVELEPGSGLLPSVLWVPRSPIRNLVVPQGEVNKAVELLIAEQNEIRKIRLEQEALLGKSINPSGLETLCSESILKMAWDSARRDAMQQVAEESKSEDLSAQLIRSSEVLLGTEAIHMHMDDPSLGYLIKSPKNFLSVDLFPEQIEFFVAITAVFLRYLKQTAEKALGMEADFVVLGRPVKYHGAGEFEPGALEIMRRAAAEAGIKDFNFEYEPIAAAVAYEHQLAENKRVLVLDAGGGTTDVTFMQLGPDRKMKAERKDDILSTSGERLGGTDLDVAFAKQFFGRAFGIGVMTKTGLPIPKSGILDALTITDIPAQTRFYGRAMTVELNEYLRDAVDKEPIKRLIEMKENHLAMRVNRSAELGKIALSDDEQVNIALDYFDNPLDIPVSRLELELNMNLYIEKIVLLMSDACSQAGEEPDEIFITGGTSKIPLMNRMVRERFPCVPIISGDNFGSVAKGLAIRAETIANAF